MKVTVSQKGKPVTEGIGTTEQPTETTNQERQPKLKDEAGNWLQDEEYNQYYEVEKILDRRRVGHSKKFEYFVKWKGYPEEENSWIPKQNIVGAEAVKMRSELDEQLNPTGSKRS